MLYAFFWVITRRLEFMCRRFGTLCSIFYSHLPSFEHGTECSETSAYKLQTPGNSPKESIQQYRSTMSVPVQNLYSLKMLSTVVSVMILKF